MIVISFQATEKDLAAIREEVKNGNAINVSDFVRRAVNEKIMDNKKAVV